jgi:hypothetical protein
VFCILRVCCFRSLHGVLPHDHANNLLSQCAFHLSFNHDFDLMKCFPPFHLPTKLQSQLSTYLILRSCARGLSLATHSIGLVPCNCSKQLVRKQFPQSKTPETRQEIPSPAMAAKTKQTPAFNPRMGVLIPSPIISYTHAIASHPFDPDALLTVKGRLRYLPEHAIDSFLLKDQAIHNAGQAIVVQEMAKLSRSEAEARRFQKFPKLDLKIHGNSKVKPLNDIPFWRKTLGWAGSEDEFE